MEIVYIVINVIIGTLLALVITPWLVNEERKDEK